MPRSLAKKAASGTNRARVRGNGRMKPVSTMDAQLRALAQRIVADRTVAEDAVQDTWVSVLARGAGGSSAWLRGALRNRARMRLRADARRRARESAVATDERAYDPAVGYERRERLPRLREAIAELPEPERTIVRRRWLDERPSRAIADELGLPPSTVRWHLARAMARLRVRMVDERRTPAWLLIPSLGRAPGRLALVVVFALTLATVATQRCAVDPPPDPPTESRIPMPKPKSLDLPTLALATALAAGCVEPPETSAPEPSVEAHARVILASEPVRVDEVRETEDPLESCADTCILSMTPRLRVDCGGVGDFDACAEQCAESFCPAGDLSFTAEDVGTIGTAGCTELWCPTGCDDATAWGQCVSDCAATASREAGDKTCSFAGVQQRLCDLECRAAEAAGASSPGM